MISKEKQLQLYWHIIGWYQKNREIGRKDFAKMLASVFENFVKDDDLHTEERLGAADDRNMIPQADVEDFSKMWDGFMQQSIDFINSHPETKKHIDEVRLKKQEQWNTEYGTDCMHPDLRISFGADCLEESVKAGKWVAATDSYCDLRVADHSVLSMM